MVPVIPAELLTSRLLRIAQRDVRVCGCALMVCGPMSLHWEGIAVAEPMHQLLTSLGYPETASAQLQAKLRQIDQKVCLRIGTAFPVLKALRDVMDPEPQVMALPFREMGDMTSGVSVKPMRLMHGRLFGRIEPQNSNTIESSATGEKVSHGVTNESRDLRIDALELVRAGISFHLEIRVETSSAAVVRTVSSWLQCLMREAQIGACGVLGHGLGRFECLASGLYLVSAQTGRATQLTRLFRARQTGYSFCKHPLLA